MAQAIHDNPSMRDVDEMGLIDTDLVVQRDHMGRHHVSTVGEAFGQDWPWILFFIAIVAFDIMALAGWFR